MAVTEELNDGLAGLPGWNFMTHGSAEHVGLSLSGQAAADESGQATWSGAWGVVWFWVVGVGLTLLTWWPLVLGPTSGLQGGDIYTYYFPMKAWYSDRLQAGELPWWNPLVGHGFPALAESQTGVLYPLHLLLYGSLPLNTAYNASFLLHYVLAFGFTCHYVRRLGYGVSQSLLASVTFVFGWFPARSCLEWAIVTGAWLPAVLWGVEGYLTTRRRWYWLVAQLALVMQLLAGHYNLAFITILAAVASVPLRLLFGPRPPLRPPAALASVAGMIVLGGMVAAVQLAPSMELKARSQRGSPEFGGQNIGYGAIPWKYMAQVIAPWRLFPHVREPEFERELLGSHNTNRVEAHLYFGLAPMVLAVVGFATAVLRRLRLVAGHELYGVWVWSVLGVCGLALATGWWADWAVQVPGFGYFTGPGRYGVLVQLAVAVLAAEGARTLLQVGEGPLRSGPAMAIAGVGLGILVIATEVWTYWADGLMGLVQASAPVQLKLCSQTQCASAVCSTLLVLGLVACWLGTAWRFALVVIALLAWGDLTLAARYVQYAEVRFDSPICERDQSVVRRLLEPVAGARLLARNQNSVTLCGVAQIPVYLGIGPREYFTGSLRVPDDFHWNSGLSVQTVRWLSWAGVTHVLAFEPMADDSLELVWAGQDKFLHDLLGRSPNQPLWLYALRGTRGRAYWVPAEQVELALEPATDAALAINPIEVHKSGANQIELDFELDQEAAVVLTELMYPGWEVFVDSQRAVPLPDGPFRAVRVGPGVHHVRWAYRPRSLRWGVMISLLGMAVTMAVGLMGTVRWSNWNGVPAGRN